MLENASIIGNTPMIKINYEYKGKESYVYTKLEFYNLTGSIKDRVAFYIINNAKPIFKGIDSCSYEEFNEALQVGVTGPFMLVKLLKDYLNEDACVINISSTRDRMSQPQSESYSAAKGGLSALTHALAVSLSKKARVNSISPGWIDTENKEYQGSDVNQHLVKRVGKVDDIAHLVLFLCSEEAGFITGENICVDGGMTKLMIYHNDYGWKLGDEDYE